MQGNELEIYGVSQEIMDEYDKKINRFKKSFSGSKKAINTKKMATQQIKCLLNDGDKLLKGQLDNLILAFKNQHPVFYNAYKNARKVSALGIRHKQDDIAA